MTLRRSAFGSTEEAVISSAAGRHLPVEATGGHPPSTEVNGSYAVGPGTRLELVRERSADPVRPQVG
jgi:hypothetical protein